MTTFVILVYLWCTVFAILEENVVIVWWGGRNGNSRDIPVINELAEEVKSGGNDGGGK